MSLRLLTLLIRCYPPDFRIEFESEMLGVLSARLTDAGRDRGPKRVLIPIKEFFGLLSSIPQAWLTARNQKEAIMTVDSIPGAGFRQETRNHQPGSFSAGLLSGLPHIGMGLLIGLGKFFESTWVNLAATWSQVIAAVLVLVIFGVLFSAWRKGWPLWSASWYLYGAWFLLALISFSASQLTQDDWQYTSLAFLAWIAAFIILYFRLYMQDPVKAMLSIAFFFPLIAMGINEFVPNWIEGSSAIGLGVACAAAAAAVVKSGSYKLALRLMIALNLGAGLLFAYIGEYQTMDVPAELQLPVHIPSFGNFLVILAYYLAFSLGVLLMPMAIWKAGNARPV